MSRTTEVKNTHCMCSYWQIADEFIAALHGTSSIAMPLTPDILTAVDLRSREWYMNRSGIDVRSCVRMHEAPCKVMAASTLYSLLYASPQFKTLLSFHLYTLLVWVDSVCVYLEEE